MSPRRSPNSTRSSDHASTGGGAPPRPRIGQRNRALNNVSFGVYAEAVHRDEYRENKEQTIAGVMREMQAGEDNGTAIRFATPEGEQAERTAITIVSNNPYVFSGPPDYGRRLRLDSGVLGISAAAEGTAVDGTTGRGVRHWSADRLLLESDEPILGGLDGEALTFDSTLELVIRPRGLRTLVPAGTKPGYVPPREAIAAGLIGLGRLGGVPGADDADESGDAGGVEAASDDAGNDG